MTDPRFPFPHRRLPPWARHDHPLVARELRLLPPFFSAKGAPLRTTVTRMVLLALIVAPCGCACGGLPWQLLLAPLGWLPLIWAAPIIVQEISAGRWAMLRATPYSVREIVLAKLSAVVYRLSPLLGFILAGQAVLVALMAVGWALLTNVATVYVSFNGATLEQPNLLPTETLPPAGTLLLGVLMMGLTILAALLDFLTNAALGGLASTLTRQRAAAYVGAFGLRVALTLLAYALTLALAGVVVEQPLHPLEVVLLAAIGGSPGWAMLAAPDSLIRPLILGGLTVAAQVAALVGIVKLVCWRAERL